MSGDAPAADETTTTEPVNEGSAGPGDPPVLKDQALSVFTEEVERYTEAGGSLEDIERANEIEPDDLGEEAVSEPESGTEPPPADPEPQPEPDTPPEPEPEPEATEAKVDEPPPDTTGDDWRWLDLDDLASQHPKPSFDSRALTGQAKDVHDYWLKCYNVRCAREARARQELTKELEGADLSDLRAKAQIVEDINNPDVREYDAIRNLVREDYQYRQMAEAFLDPTHPEHHTVIRTYQLGMSAREDQGGFDDEPVTRADLQRALADQREQLLRKPPDNGPAKFTDWMDEQQIPRAEAESFVQLHERKKAAGQGPIPGKERLYWGALWDEIQAQRNQDHERIQPPPAEAVAEPEVQKHVDTLRRHIPDAEPKPRRVGGGRRERPDISGLDADEIFALVQQGKIDPEDYPEIGGVF